ncbi:MAG: hypothetical protein JAY77_08790 [Candidatus Thiodiazotropha taylori]|uniref:Uncharacterized protein n=1 Tax=Candidatus Thiodiazotropha taylori TaxID=2792791 RepID=A0A9E4NJX9_9GAMM|nr:hypothetical protein [Candidatus Thiodiazotropha taylori]
MLGPCYVNFAGHIGAYIGHHTPAAAWLAGLLSDIAIHVRSVQLTQMRRSGGGGGQGEGDSSRR